MSYYEFDVEEAAELGITLGPIIEGYSEDDDHRGRPVDQELESSYKE